MDQIDNYLGTVIPVIKLSTHPSMIPWYLTILYIHIYLFILQSLRVLGTLNKILRNGVLISHNILK